MHFPVASIFQCMRRRGPWLQGGSDEALTIARVKTPRWALTNVQVSMDVYREKLEARTGGYCLGAGTG